MPEDPPSSQTLDGFLRVMVYMTERTGFEAGLTLNVGGLIVSGTLCNASTYFEGLAGELGRATGNEVTISTLKKMFMEWAEEMKPIPLPEDDETDDDSEIDPQKLWLVHLKDARYYGSGGQTIPGGSRGVYWRGRLEAVDGFSLGQLADA